MVAVALAVLAAVGSFAVLTLLLRERFWPRSGHCHAPGDDGARRGRTMRTINAPEN